MLTKVMIVDDTFRRNGTHRMTLESRRLFFKKFGRLPQTWGDQVLSKDRQGRQMQETVKVLRIFEGAHLENAVRRAKRWMRSPRFRRTDTPRHIALAMAAFHKADPEGFKRALT